MSQIPPAQQPAALDSKLLPALPEVPDEPEKISFWLIQIVPRDKKTKVLGPKRTFLGILAIIDDRLRMDHTSRENFNKLRYWSNSTGKKPNIHFEINGFTEDFGYKDDEGTEKILKLYRDTQLERHTCQPGICHTVLFGYVKNTEPDYLDAILRQMNGMGHFSSLEDAKKNGDTLIRLHREISNSEWFDIDNTKQGRSSMSATLVLRAEVHKTLDKC